MDRKRIKLGYRNTPGGPLMYHSYLDENRTVIIEPITNKILAEIPTIKREVIRAELNKVGSWIRLSNSIQMLPGSKIYPELASMAFDFLSKKPEQPAANEEEPLNKYKSPEDLREAVLNDMKTGKFQDAEGEEELLAEEPEEAHTGEVRLSKMPTKHATILLRGPGEGGSPRKRGRRPKSKR